MKETMKILDLFSGIGGFSYAAEHFFKGKFETTQFVEIDPFCQKVLSKNFKGVPIHDDIKTFTAKQGQFDVLTAGFPCQDLSVAGRQLGFQGTRSSLFYECIRLLREIQPKFAIFENVRNLLSIEEGRVFQEVLFQITKPGYNVEWAVVSARDVGGGHLRERVWLLCYPSDSKLLGRITPERLRFNAKTNSSSQKRKNKTIELERASRSQGETSIRGTTTTQSTNSNNIRHQGGWSETCNKTSSGQDTQIIRSTNTDNIDRQTDDGEDKRKSRINESASRSSDGGKTISTNTRGVCELSQRADNYKEISRQDNHQENNDRTLVSEGQSRVQLSNSRELGRNQTTFENNSIRQGDDNSKNKRMDSENSNESTYSNDTRLEGFGRQHELQESCGEEKTRWRTQPYTLEPDWRSYNAEPTICRNNDGVSKGLHSGFIDRKERIKSLGNAVTPQQAAIPLGRIIDLISNRTSISNEMPLSVLDLAK